MKNDQYFKHDTGASGNRKLMKLIDELGMKGYGVYWLLMETLRMQDGYRAPTAILKRLAHRARVKPAFLLQIIQNYELFVVNDEHFHSPGMTRRMRPYTVKTASSRYGNDSQEATNRLETSETIPPNARKEEKKEIRKEEEKKEETPPLILKENNWEACIDSAFGEQSWVEIQAMHSGMGLAFTKHRQEIIDFFKLHVRTYGKESALCCVNDAKSYFSNFIRPASATQKALLAELAKQSEHRRKDNPYRHETLDPATSQRTYCGQTIPREAPPRPHACAVWDDALHRWGR